MTTNELDQHHVYGRQIKYREQELVLVGALY